ncbi:hypothetical protein GDO78_000188 [Eleutherodactylus coqui]|uniref:Secreted protein n=1 Tax=Eleutherodactylus coqui TaxID=57060 RepID=A0A8J6FNK6_ELECQ|nr:hypothetical protein GDO78_000188 [Eleutherodactylus coqui]
MKIQRATMMFFVFFLVTFKATANEPFCTNLKQLAICYVFVLSTPMLTKCKLVHLYSFIFVFFVFFVFFSQRITILTHGFCAKNSLFNFFVLFLQ